LLGELAAVDANVLDVVHERTGARLHVDEVEVALQVETRGAEHCETVLARLRSHGYAVEFDKPELNIHETALDSFGPGTVR
jgi:threonine dehydratase